MQLPPVYAQRLASQRRLLLLLSTEIDAVDVEIHRRLQDHAGYRNLLTVKGIGPVLAAMFVVEIGDVSRFGTAAQLACWAGLTPRHCDSDRTVRRGHISKEGSTLVRWAGDRGDPTPVRAGRPGGQGIGARRGKTARNIAKVAAAHRMLDVVFYVLRDGHAKFLDESAAASATAACASSPAARGPANGMTQPRCGRLN